MQKNSDKTVAAISVVVVTAARLAAVVGKQLEHEIEQLRGFCDFHFGHWFARSRSGVTNAAYHGLPRSASSLAYRKTIGSTELGLLFLRYQPMY
jgi:hypothetical protein